MKIIKGIFCLVKVGNGPQIVCPESIKTAVLDRVHNNFGHLGINATVSLIREGFFWINLRSEIEEYERNCQICCETRPRFQKPEDGTLISSSKPIERLSLDLIGPKITPSGKKKWIFTIVYEYSRFLETFPFDSATSKFYHRI